MKRLISITFPAVFALCLNSCNDAPSKQFKMIDDEVKTIGAKINEITSCDELQMMNFGILGLRSDMDNYRQGTEMSETEISKLDEMIDQLEATWNGKWSVLDCEQQMTNDELDTSGEEAGESDYNIM